MPMIMAAQGTTHPRGEAFLGELLYIHGLIRRNIDTVRSVAEEVTQGASAEAIQSSLKQLSSMSVIWQLRAGCLQYCHFVHEHHGIEDAVFFPALREAEPELASVIDRLQSDHVVVAKILDEIEATATHLEQDINARADLIGSLQRLSEHLLAHLDYEESNLAPTLKRIQSWSLDY